MEKSLERAIQNAMLLTKQGERLHISDEAFGFADDYEMGMECYTTYHPTKHPGVYKTVSVSPFFNGDIESHTVLTEARFKNMELEE